MSTTNKVSSNGASVKTETTPSTSKSSDHRPSRSTSLARGKATSRDASNCSSPNNADQIKKIPPIKAPVGLAKGPQLTKVQSKIGSLSNIKHRPAGGEKKVASVKLEWNASSKIGSLDNATHKPRGGDVVVPTQKLQWNTSSKVGSLANIKHKAGGGNVQIFDEKYKVANAATSCSRSASEMGPEASSRQDTPVAMQSAGIDDDASLLGDKLDQLTTNGSGKNCASARGDVCTKTVTSASSSARAPASKGSSAAASSASSCSRSPALASQNTSLVNTNCTPPMPATRKTSTDRSASTALHVTNTRPV